MHQLLSLFTINTLPPANRLIHFPAQEFAKKSEETQLVTTTHDFLCYVLFREPCCTWLTALSVSVE